jgi:hypothetical protein
VVLLDGQLTIQSQPRDGTRLTAELRIVDREPPQSHTVIDAD